MLIVADEYTEFLRAESRRQADADVKMREDFVKKGGHIKKCPPYTPGGPRVFSVDERPERRIISTEGGFKVLVGEEI